MHDNDPQHTPGIVTHCLKQNTIQTLPFKSFVTGFKSHQELKRRVKKHQPKNLEKVEVQLTQEWNNNELSVL